MITNSIDNTRLKTFKRFVFFRHDHAFCAGHLHAVVAGHLCPGLHEQRRAGWDHRRTTHATHGLQQPRWAQDLPARTGQVLRDCWKTEVHKRHMSQAMESQALCKVLGEFEIVHFCLTLKFWHLAIADAISQRLLNRMISHLQLAKSCKVSLQWA